MPNIQITFSAPIQLKFSRLTKFKVQFYLSVQLMTLPTISANIYFNFWPPKAEQFNYTAGTNGQLTELCNIVSISNISKIRKWDWISI